jgi:hypothetical protein
MLLFPIGYVLLLVFSRIWFDRYLLPVVVWMHYLAALGIIEGVRLLPRPRLQWSVACVALIGLILPQSALCFSYLRQFDKDSREQLALWVSRNVPPDAVILEDNYARLYTHQKHGRFAKRIKCKIVSKTWAAEIGSLDRAKKRKITHVAICSMAYGRFFDEYMMPDPQSAESVRKMKSFYEEVFAKGKLIWRADSDGEIGDNTNPSIYLFDIRDPDALGSEKQLLVSTPIRIEEE